MAKSDKRPIIKLKSTAGTGYTYVTRKNKTNTRERIELKKYDPKVRQHVIFKEALAHGSSTRPAGPVHPRRSLCGIVSGAPGPPQLDPRLRGIHHPRPPVPYPF